MNRTEFLSYFEPISLSSIAFVKGEGYERWGDKMFVNSEHKPLEDIDAEVKIALIGVKEDRGSLKKQGCAYNPDEVRRFFYQLMPQATNLKMVDLGNLRIGNTLNDTYFAMGEVIGFLLKKGIIPVVIGGSNDLAIGMYRGYVNVSQIINMMGIDAKFDLISDEDPVSDENFLHEILCSEPNYLFDYTHLGYQTYFVDYKALELLDDLHFERFRLGVIHNNLGKCEPIIRDADLMIIDTNCLRASDAPSSPSPHGFYGEELCKIVNYAGMSDKLTSIGFFGNNVLEDLGGRTSQIIAHAIYYFIEGVLWRKNDYPSEDDDNYLTFKVLTTNLEDEITFYKSKKSDRWWIKVPCTDLMKQKYIRHYIVPCLYSDYEAAGRGQLPERWFIAYHKLNV